MLLAFPPKYFSPLHSLPIRLSENTFFYILLLNTGSVQKSLKFGHGTERESSIYLPFSLWFIDLTTLCQKGVEATLCFFPKRKEVVTLFYTVWLFFVLNKKRGFLQYNTCDTFLLSNKILKTHVKQHMYFWFIIQKRS